MSLAGTLYFANDGAHGTELWKTDGTGAGTAMVKDIWSGSVSSKPTWLTDVGGTLYFSARDTTHGRELWKSDGTAAGTTLVKDIVNGPGDSSPGRHCVRRNALLLRKRQALEERWNRCRHLHREGARIRLWSHLPLRSDR